MTTQLLAVLSLALGLVYTSYGVMTIIDLRRGWSERGASHFGMAWIAMAFTCGPHHLAHGIHLAFEGRHGGTLETVAVLAGVPFGVTWFLLRVEALRGGTGDRAIRGTPLWVAALPLLSAVYVVGMLVAAGVSLGDGAVFRPTMAPNVLLVGVYTLIGYYILRAQIQNNAGSGGWSLSGVSLGFVFPTCAVMHGAWMVHAATGRYHVDSHGLVIDWLAVPAAFYFLWVVQGLYRHTMSDWNESAGAFEAAAVSA